MNKTAVTWIIIVVVVIGGIGAWWIMSQSGSTKTNESATSQTTSGNDTNTAASSPAATASATITYTNQGFSPSTVTVKSGDTIKIVNQSSVSLQFSSDDHPAHTDDTELNMGTIAAGKEGSLTVTKKGTWGYHNHLKPGDTGSLIVN